MRTEVGRLRDVLAARLEAGPRAAGDDDFSANKEISALITGVAAARARESMSAMRRSVEAAAGPASVCLDDGTILEEHEVLELEMLQLENEELRCVLRVLGVLGNPLGADYRHVCLNGELRCVLGVLGGTEGARHSVPRVRPAVHMRAVCRLERS